MVAAFLGCLAGEELLFARKNKSHPACFSPLASTRNPCYGVVCAALLNFLGFIFSKNV